MPLDNSTVQEPLPNDLQARIENGQNLVIALEAEVARLQKYVISAKDQTVSLHEEKNYLEGQIEENSSKLIKLTGAVKKAEEELNSLTHKVADARHEIEESERQKQEIIDEANKLMAELHSREADIKKEEADLAARALDLDKHKRAHEQKVGKLLAVLKE